MLSQAPLLCSLDAFLQHLSRPRPLGSPRGASGEQFFGKLDRQWLWRSVRLSLSKKGHRKTFAKNKLFRRTLSTLRPGLFREAAPSGGLGCQSAAGPAASAWGAHCHAPSPHPATPSFPGAQVHVSSLGTELVLGRLPASPLAPSTALLPVCLSCSAGHRVLASLRALACFLLLPHVSRAPAALPLLRLFPGPGMSFSLPNFPWLIPPRPPIPCETQLHYHLLGNSPWPPGGSMPFLSSHHALCRPLSWL